MADQTLSSKRLQLICEPVRVGTPSRFTIPTEKRKKRKRRRRRRRRRRKRGGKDVPISTA